MVLDRVGDHITYERQGYLNPTTEVHREQYPRQTPRYNFQDERMVLCGNYGHITHGRQGYTTPNIESHSGPQHPSHVS